jgi:hypothetical protein
MTAATRPCSSRPSGPASTTAPPSRSTRTSPSSAVTIHVPSGPSTSRTPVEGAERCVVCGAHAGGEASREVDPRRPFAVDVTAWALVPVASVLVMGATAVSIVMVALRGTASRDRAPVLKAVAEVIRALRGRK